MSPPCGPLPTRTATVTTGSSPPSDERAQPTRLYSVSLVWWPRGQHRGDDSRHHFTAFGRSERGRALGNHGAPAGRRDTYSPPPLSVLVLCWPPDVVDRSSGTGMGSSPSSGASLTGGLSFPGEKGGSMSFWGLWSPWGLVPRDKPAGKPSTPGPHLVEGDEEQNYINHLQC